MSKGKRRAQIPQRKTPNLNLDHVDSDSTTQFTKPSDSRRSVEGNSVDVGPAQGGVSDDTPITHGQFKTYGKLGAFIVASVGLIGGPIWWAATMQSVVNSLVVDISSIEESTSSLEKDFIRHDERVKQLEKEVSEFRDTSRNHNTDSIPPIKPKVSQ